MHLAENQERSGADTDIASTGGSGCFAPCLLEELLMNLLENLRKLAIPRCHSSHASSPIAAFQDPASAFHMLLSCRPCESIDLANPELNGELVTAVSFVVIRTSAIIAEVRVYSEVFVRFF